MIQVNMFRIVFIAIFLFSFSLAQAQYVADFNDPTTGFSENNIPGWRTITGDGEVIFKQRFDGQSVILQIDPDKDKRNIWYAFLHQDISSFIDKNKALLSKYGLRMEARVKTSHAPRRINMYLSSLNSGGYLREFDIPVANEWHTISMVTQNATFSPDLPLMAQISLMDWGISSLYTLSIDYIKVDVIEIGHHLSQYGNPLEYRPPLKESSFYEEELIVSDDATIDASFPDENLSHWSVIDNMDTIPLLQVDQTKKTLLKWDFSRYRGKKIDGAGQLEIYTFSLSKNSNSPKDFGEIRFCEILHQPLPWSNEKITFGSFLNGMNLNEVINSQTIIDSKINPIKGSKTVVTISQPVLQRLFDGKSFGIALGPLGLITTYFFDRSSKSYAARLRFNISEN